MWGVVVDVVVVVDVEGRTTWEPWKSCKLFLGIEGTRQNPRGP